MGWSHWSAPVAGVMFLGYLWLLFDGAMRHPDERDRPPLDGLAVCLLASTLYVVLADVRLVEWVLFGLLVLGAAAAVLVRLRVLRLPRLPWRPPGPWTVLLFGLPDLFTPVGWVRAAWRRTAPLRWCVAHPVTARTFHRMGYRGPRVVATLARWFRPAQLERLGWPVPAVSAAVDRMAFVDCPEWDAERFIGAVRASGRDHADQLVNWRGLHRLGVDDPAGYLRYLAAGSTVPMALQYGLGADAVPYDVVVALQRRGAANLWSLLYSLQREHRNHHTRWSDILAWIRHDESPEFTRALTTRATTWNDDTYLRRWRAWAPVAGRAPEPEPALWAAAGFTVEEAMEVLDSGEVPDAEALRGLAALRRTA